MADYFSTILSDSYYDESAGLEACCALDYWLAPVFCFLAQGSNLGASIAYERLADFRLMIYSFSDSLLELSPN